MAAKLLLAVLLGALGVGMALAWPLHLHVRVSRRPGGPARAYLRLGLVPLYRGKLPPPRKKKKRAKPKPKAQAARLRRAVLRSIPSLVRRGHVQRFTLRATVGIRGDGATALQLCAWVQLLTVPLLCSDACAHGRLQVQLRPEDGCDTLQGELACMVWLRPWHIIRTVISRWKEN